MSSELQDMQSKNRNFICSCQKAYLSYAALFTHIKQKHGGKAPGQIVRPRSLNKRGRPRKNDKPSTEKGVKGESYNGFSNNNKLKNSNLANELNINQNLSGSKTPFGQGFTSYKNQKCPGQRSGALKRPEKSQQLPVDNHDSMRQILRQFDEGDMEFANPNNQFSSNTLTLASIIVGLQQVFKDVDCLELVKDDRLQSFSSYLNLKRFHSLKLVQNNDQKLQQDVFILGNIICAFLNFCHQTLDDKAAYQQMLLLMVCLLEHINERESGNILVSCRKEAIHESLPSFFQQYLDRLIIKQKFNFQIFKRNNPFKVLIWFLNWLSAIEDNYVKNNLIQNPIQQGIEYDQEIQDDQAVEFQHPLFLKEVAKRERFQTQNKTQISIQKKKVEADLSKKEENDYQEGVESSEDLQKIENQQNSQKDHEDSQFNSNQGQSQQNKIIGFQRLSSEVR